MNAVVLLLWFASLKSDLVLSKSELVPTKNLYNVLIDFSLLKKGQIAKLVDVLSSDDDLSRRFHTGSSLNLGFLKLYSIVGQAIEPTADDANKLGLQLWDQSQIQAVASLELALVNSTRSLSVEQVEPVIVMAIQLSIEFPLSYLEN